MVFGFGVQEEFTWVILGWDGLGVVTFLLLLNSLNEEQFGNLVNMVAGPFCVARIAEAPFATVLHLCLGDFLNLNQSLVWIRTLGWDGPVSPQDRCSRPRMTHGVSSEWRALTLANQEVGTHATIGRREWR